MTVPPSSPLTPSAHSSATPPRQDTPSGQDNSSAQDTLLRLSLPWQTVCWALYALLLMQQLPRIFREEDFFESLNYYAVADLHEYPTVAVWPLKWMAFLGVDVPHGFAALLVVVQAAILLVCVRAGKKEAAFLWLAYIWAIGPLMLSRMDLLPGAAVAVALALVARFPAVSGGVLAVATGMKLWPGLVAAALLGSWRRVAGFVATFVALVGVSTAVHGWGRTISPLTYQADRGLQIESVFGAPLLLRGDTRIDFAESMSYEVFGGGVSTLTVVADAAQVAVVVVAAVLGVLTAVRWRPQLAVACASTIVWLIIATNKVFSPQYVLWIVPLMLVVVSVTQRPLPRLMAWLCVPLSVLTTLVYPLMYQDILLAEFGPVLLLNVRNVLVLVLAASSTVWWWQEWRQTPQGQTPQGQTPQGQTSRRKHPEGRYAA